MSFSFVQTNTKFHRQQGHHNNWKRMHMRYDTNNNNNTNIPSSVNLSWINPYLIQILKLYPNHPSVSLATQFSFCSCNILRLIIYLFLSVWESVCIVFYFYCMYSLSRYLSTCTFILFYFISLNCIYENIYYKFHKQNHASNGRTDRPSSWKGDRKTSQSRGLN